MSETAAPAAGATAGAFLSAVPPITLIIIAVAVIVFIVILIGIFGFLHPTVGGLQL